MADQGTDDLTELVWRGELGLQRIIKLKEDLGEALSRSREVRLHLVDVSEVDIAFLQLLCAAHRTAMREGKRLRLTGAIPGVFTEVLQLAGLDRHVGCAIDRDASCLLSRPGKP